MSGTWAQAPLNDARQLGLVGRVALVGVVAGGVLLAAANTSTLLFFVSYSAVGAVLVVRRPANPVSWLVLVIGFGFLGTTSLTAVDAAALVNGTPIPRDAVLLWLQGWLWNLTFIGLAALMYLFPNGRLPEGRAGLRARIILGVGVAFGVGSAFRPTLDYARDDSATLTVPNPLAVAPDLPIWAIAGVGFGAMVIVLAIGVVELLLRYRRSSGIARLQLRWLVVSIVLVFVGLMLGIGADLAFSHLGGIEWVPVILAFILVPISIGVAILRYRLYELDRIVSRTISWALTTALIAAVFGGLIVGLQALLSPITRDSTLAVAASTVVAAAAFQPLRRRVQVAADRRFYRSRVDAERTIDALATRLRDDVDLESIAGELRGTIAVSLAPSSLSVWLRGR